MHFHGTLKTACDAHDAGHYARFKRWCDDYFLVPHRHERRGVGGIFFDDLEVCSTDSGALVRLCSKLVMPTRSHRPRSSRYAGAVA